MELEALYRADEALHRSLHLDDVLQALVEVATDLLSADKASVWVWDADRRELVVGAARGLSEATLSTSLPLEDIQVLPEPSDGEVATVDDYTTDARVSPRLREISQREGFRSTITAAIRVGGEVFGMFALGYAEPGTFDDEHRRLLLALAQRAALAIHNARLYEQAQQVATLDERQRLARELHDAVTQTLFSASLLAEVTPRLWERDPVEGRRRLEEIRQLTRGALAEMRTLLLELRPAALTEVGLDVLLRQLGEALASLSELTVDVGVQGVPRMLPGDAQVTLYRLAQEALNNVAKHARARRATVELAWLPNAVRLKIEDQGLGFDPSSVPPGHLGLGIMRERAASMGATANIASRPGHGTRVEIVWPEPPAARRKQRRP